ncbi:hypothetical protein [Nocardia cyriacigeorgica]|uniref:hypothetical protein n=1 Tax=Nocardia cyriacigeorgica TaxID=135487 RepID=UPI002455010E|nr:hypothetical protein [Nocardia cyriacigeorgica]
MPGAEGTRRLARAAVARWGAATVHRVVCAVAWAIAGALSAIGLVVIVVWLPPGDEPGAVARFFDEFNPILRGAAFIAACAMVYVVWLSANLTSRLVAADTSPRGHLGRLLWTCETIFYGVFAVMVGVFAALPLLSGEVSDEVLAALHVAVLVTAAPLGLLGVPYLWAMYAIAKRSGLFPDWLATTVLVCLVLNLSPATGFFVLTGPFNAVDGVICLGGNLIAFFILPAVVNAWMINEWIDEDAADVAAQRL